MRGLWYRDVTDFRLGNTKVCGDSLMGHKFYLSLIFIFSLTQQSWSQSTVSEEEKLAWSKTGYGIPELFNEPEFQINQCLSSAKKLAACLMTVDFIAEQFTSQPQKLEIQSDGYSLAFIAQEKTLDTVVKDNAFYEQQKAVLQRFLSFEALWGHYSANDLESLFRDLKSRIDQQVKLADQPQVAGLAYETLLHMSYDPHSRFIPQELLRSRPQNYFGIGALVQKHTQTELPYLKGGFAVSPISGYSAAQAGLVKGDVIIALNGQSVVSLSVSEFVDLVKGPEGTSVEVQYHSFCEQKLKTTTVFRQPVRHVSDWLKDSRFVSLESHDLDPVVELCKDGRPSAPKAGTAQALYIPLKTFMPRAGQDLCAEFVELQIRDLKNPDSRGMILDLRNNGGGDLDAVSCMLDSLISSHIPMIGQVRVRNGEVVGSKSEISHYFTEQGYIDSAKGPFNYMRPLVVLVNENSASASEIFAGAIQDMQRGWIVGERTLGKGSVQTLVPHLVARQFTSWSDQTLLIGKTTAIYTLPSGRSPQKVGILPDFRYLDNGDLGMDREDRALTIEATLLNSIAYTDQLVQSIAVLERPSLEPCIYKNSSLNQDVLKKQKQDERYSRPFILSFREELAKDIVFCADSSLVSAQTTEE